MTPIRLKSILDGLLAEDDLEQNKKTGDTYCNFGVQSLMRRGYDYYALDGLTANQIHDYLASHPKEWAKVSSEEAVNGAMQGRCVIAAKKYEKHGHVAGVAPVPALFSGSWNKYVPVVCNIGKRPNGYMKASLAFPVDDGEPDYFFFYDKLRETESR